MNKPVRSNLHPIGKSLILFGFCVIGLALTAAVSLGILSAYDLDLKSKLGLQIQTFAGQIGGFLIPVVVFVAIFKKESVEGFYVKSTKAINWILTIGLAFLALGIINYLGELNALVLEGRGGIIATLKEFEEEAAEVTMKMLSMETPTDLLVNLFLVAVIPAFCEELFFRGVLQNQLAKVIPNIHVAIWLSAAVFSAIHFQFFGFIPRMVLGAIFGYLLIYSGSIWMPILAHFLNNAFGVTTYYLAQNTDLIDMDEVENTPIEWYFGMLSAVLVFGIIWLMKRQNHWPRIQHQYQKFEMFPDAIQNDGDSNLRIQ